MMVHQIIGSVGYVAVWLTLTMSGIALYGTTATNPHEQSDELACGVDLRAYGSGVVACEEEGMSTWSDNDRSYIYMDERMTVTRVWTEAGYLSEVVIDKEEGSITSYVG